MKPIVFIDRDGVINVDPIGDYVTKWQDFRFEEGAVDALQRIARAGLDIILISNQAGVGEGVFSESTLWDIHQKMIEELKKSGIRIHASHYCLHGKKAGCGCRKPETGLFHEATKNLRYDPSKTFFIGDKATDVEAGKRFGIRTIFVRTGHGRLDESKLRGALTPDFVVNNLQEAVGVLLG